MYSNSISIIKRGEGEAPDGTSINMRWVLRINGKLIDCSDDRFELAKRNGFKLII